MIKKGNCFDWVFMKKIVLFDMDGTLTPPRQKMGLSLIKPFSELQKNGFEIGIVSGSDLDYIEEQCALLWDINLVDPAKIHYLPCNGTKYYLYKENSGFQKISDCNMKQEIGNEKYVKIINVLLGAQLGIWWNCPGLHSDNIPISGTFIQYRGSMINWCPIGRSATEEDRSSWIKLDKEYSIRKKELCRIPSNPCFDNITIKLGGETSFDIYPTGWDKTYAWNIFQDYNEIYFVGDRCFPEGNDYEAYIKAGNNGFITTGPSETIKIISKILNRSISGN